MTNEDVRSELEKDPFVPLRFHLVSGHSIEVARPGKAFMLKHAVMVLHERNESVQQTAGYNVVALRNIEMIEQLKTD